MPKCKKIDEYWLEKNYKITPLAYGYIGCYSCYREFPDYKGLDRAHIIDRSDYGLDFECNLFLLCSFCHASQPIFEADKIEEAFDWVLNANPFYDFLNSIEIK